MDFESADPTPQTRVEVSRYKKIWSRQLHTKWHKEGIEMAAPWRGWWGQSHQGRWVKEEGMWHLLSCPDRFPCGFTHAVSTVFWNHGILLCNKGADYTGQGLGEQHRNIAVVPFLTYSIWFCLLLAAPLVCVGDRRKMNEPVQSSLTRSLGLRQDSGINQITTPINTLVTGLPETQEPGNRCTFLAML